MTENSAIPVRINSNGYSGQWSLKGNQYSGDAIVQLTPGAYQLPIGSLGGITFSLAPDGSVSTTDTASATAGARELTFNTAPISIIANGYEGEWQIEFASSRLCGDQSLKLVSGIKYGLKIGGFSKFLFTVEADGTLSTPAAASARAQENTLFLNTVDVRIEPQDQLRRWSLDYTSQRTAFIGPRTLSLVPDVSYMLRTTEPIGAAMFAVTAIGEIKPGTLAAGGLDFVFSRQGEAATRTAPIVPEAHARSA